MSSKSELTNPVVRWVDERLPVFSYMQHEYRDFPMPKNLNYFWNFGALASICLVVMIVTGIILSMHYTPHVPHLSKIPNNSTAPIRGMHILLYRSRVTRPCDTLTHVYLLSQCPG